MARMVVGPDEPFHELHGADQWGLPRCGPPPQRVDPDAQQLRRLPREVERSEQLRGRIGHQPHDGIQS